MPANRKMYIERKTRNGTPLQDAGPAVIGEVSFSRTGQTVYYKDHVFTKIGRGIYLDANRDEFWITGVKKRGSNRFGWATGQAVVENGDL